MQRELCLISSKKSVHIGFKRFNSQVHTSCSEIDTGWTFTWYGDFQSQSHQPGVRTHISFQNSKASTSSISIIHTARMKEIHCFVSCDIKDMGLQNSEHTTEQSKPREHTLEGIYVSKTIMLAGNLLNQAALFTYILQEKFSYKELWDLGTRKSKPSVNSTELYAIGNHIFLVA